LYDFANNLKSEMLLGCQRTLNQNIPVMVYTLKKHDKWLLTGPIVFSTREKGDMCHLIGFWLLVDENTGRGAFTQKKSKPCSTLNSGIWLLNNLTLKCLIYVPLGFLVALFSGGLTYGWAYYLSL